MFLMVVLSINVERSPGFQRHFPVHCEVGLNRMARLILSIITKPLSTDHEPITDLVLGKASFIYSSYQPHERDAVSFLSYKGGD